MTNAVGFCTTLLALFQNNLSYSSLASEFELASTGTIVAPALQEPLYQSDSTDVI